MAGVHRNGDTRECGATTTVNGQSSVFANGKLIAVNGDPNSHLGGALIASINNVFINGKAIIINGDDAENDIQGHLNTDANAGSTDVFAG